ncbi:MAG TPA: Ig-like domain-containing protein [Polyangiaceae bacterium]|nr:Ig-like domain-containing protein [Polyangiaceae bacterium]
MLRTAPFLLLLLSSVAAVSACGSNPVVQNKDQPFDAGGNDDDLDAAAAGSNGNDSGLIVGNAGSNDGVNETLTVKAERTTVTVELGAALPKVAVTAYLGDVPVKVAWSVDRGDLASVSPGVGSKTSLVPTGSAGGQVTVTAVVGDQQAHVDITIQIDGTQNGADTGIPGQVLQVPTSVEKLTEGGGPGGVGGQGLGPAVDDDAVLDALNDPGSDGSSLNLKLVYPYDGTVFPRGVLAPLIAWDFSKGDADAIKIELSTKSGSFHWSGSFGRPAILTDTGGPFVQHPIPQDVWERASNSASGKADPLTMALTVASGGEAYGPLEQHWVIADARLSGIIYYNSYGTQLAKNFTGAVAGDGKFGGATLGIRVGDADPKLVAGGDGASSNCRVCHSVSADGSRLVSANQDGGTWSYALNVNGDVDETKMGNYAEFPGMYPDGSLALSALGQVLPLPDATASMASTGLSDIATNIGTPMFSPDGKRLVFNPLSGGSTVNPKQKLFVVDFDRKTLAFSNPIVAVDYSGQPDETRPGWPAFFPDGKSIVYHRQTKAGFDGNELADLRTRKGALARLYWNGLSGTETSTALNQLNGLDATGKSYLAPLSAPVTLNCKGDGSNVGDIQTSHESDVDLNYEPTVNPVAGGGYAWVVFTSRRRYAHVATIPPFCSDPRGVDLLANITPKKLWVAAIDLDAKPGKDASHPAFYLPGQELMAGNSRGFWVLDPCRADGKSCATGDQCCNGFCQPDADTGALVCGAKPPTYSCSGLQDKCSTSVDCCDKSHSCIGGFCGPVVPK